MPSTPPASTLAVVSSFNEWDPLEEVVVGDVRGAMHSAWNVVAQETIPPFAAECRRALHDQAGRPVAPQVVDRAMQDLDGFVRLLEGESVIVRRPVPIANDAPIVTPGWSVPNGLCAANPRDVFLVVGDEIIEAAMPDRSRYFESWAFRPLLLEYFERGARWTAAPKPRLLDEQYDLAYRPPADEEPMRYVITDLEPVFDAADFVRCGRDIVGQLSHVTNAGGVEWLARHLAPHYRVHLLETRCRQPMHIDTTIMPLAPGRLLVNPEFVDARRLPAVFRTWDILVAPRPTVLFTSNPEARVVSDWMSMNVLMLDERRVVVEANQLPLIRALEAWGFEPIPCPFEGYYPFGGGFHCVTNDIRRRGSLASYV